MDKYSKEEQTRSTMRKLDQGDGISVTMGVGDDVDYFFTNKVDGIKRSTKKALGEIEVEISSAKADDERLLQKLHTTMSKGD